jgi:hypothetical protein
MGAQSSIADQGKAAALNDRPCAWCGAPSAAERTVVKEQRDRDKELKKPGVRVPLCEVHRDMVDRNEEVSSAWRRRKLALKNLDHPDEKKRGAAWAKVQEAEDVLRKHGERIDEPKTQPGATETVTHRGPVIA